MSLEIVELLKRLNEAGTTVIMVTHAHDLVTRFDKRVIVLNSGAVVADGSIESGDELIQESSHLLTNSNLNVGDKFSNKNKPAEEKEEGAEQKSKRDDDAFYDALLGDNDAYRVYLENEKSDGENAEEKGGEES